jgi:hypothetical protein
VKTHVTRILTKLELRDRVQAVVYAHRHNLGGADQRQLPTAMLRRGPVEVILLVADTDRCAGQTRTGLL